jgi:hypothetical protein
MAKAKAQARPKAAGLPTRIVVHAPAGLSALDRKALAKDLAVAAPKLPKLEVTDDLAAQAGGRTLLAHLAGARVADVKIPNEFHTATTADVEFEAAIDSPTSSISSARLVGLLYDGNLAAQAALNAIAPGERSTDVLHLWITRRLLGTYSKDDMRYHARFAIYGYPAIFSVLGLGLAPAPSMEAVLFSRELAKRGANAGQIEAELDKAYPEERLDIDDPPTLTAAVASAILQAAAASAGQGPFCSEPKCRLYNPHRKREMRESMIGGRLCGPHAKLFGSGGPSK